MLCRPRRRVVNPARTEAGRLVGVAQGLAKHCCSPIGFRVGDAVDPCVAAELPVLLVLDLAGTFAFALSGGLTAVRAAHVDIVGVITLGVITALGGGIIRDVLHSGFTMLPRPRPISCSS
jgi:hypothetical protein